MPSLKGFQGDGRYIHKYYAPSIPCFHMNRGEHLLMLYLYWIGILLVINSNSDHTATSTSSYLGCKSISYQFFKNCSKSSFGKNSLFKDIIL